MRFRVLSCTLAAAVASMVVVALGPGTSAAVVDGPTLRAAAAPVTPAANGKLLAPPPYAVAKESPDWLIVPGGLVYKSCDHLVPPGGRVDSDGNIVIRGVVHHVAKCPYSGLARPDASDGLTPPVPTYAHGWWGYSWWNHNWVDGISAQWTVPTNPASNGNTDFFFPSLENGAGNSIVQPVLQWGTAANGGGNIWVISDWYLSGSSTYYDSPIRVYAGHTITGSSTGSSCNSSGGGCSFMISSNDVTSGLGHTFFATTPEIWTSAQGGVFEQWNTGACNQLPASGRAAFTNIKVYTGSWHQLTPAFTTAANTSCGTHSATTSTTTTITWTP